LIESEREIPRTVSRGLEIQPIFLGLDSLYLVIEYPHIDVFRFWSSFIADGYDKHLYDGVPIEDMLIRRGGLGYKLSVWLGDARLFITDRVDDALSGTNHDGHGMGLMLQLGPKWLCTHPDISSTESLSQGICNLLNHFKVPNPQDYKIRINRIDIALDVIGLPMNKFSVDEWRTGWVGRASGKKFYDDAQTGQLPGLTIGSSQGAVRFKIYDKLLQSVKDKDSLFWFSVWDYEWTIENMSEVSVTRFEWSIFPHKAKFVGIRYLKDYSFDGLRELLNYVTQKWGRLCTTQSTVNKSRWENHPLWVRIRRIMIEEWDIDHVGVAKRDYHLEPDLNDAYLSSVTGWLGGLMARIGVVNGYGKPADLLEAIVTAEKHSKRVEQKAQNKWEILSRLVGRKANED
jgi:hypothetical protein